MLDNALLDDDYYQYKFKKYTLGEYYSDQKTLKNVIKTNFIIKPKELFSYDKYKISIESTIQRLSNEILPDEFDLDSWHQLSLQLTNDYGFLYFNQYMQSAKDEIELLQHTDWNWPLLNECMEKNPYKGESVNEWKKLILTVQQITMSLNKDESPTETKKYFLNSSVANYLKGVNPTFDFDKQLIKLECESLASAIILSIVSNRRHLMSCYQCNKLFYSKRSDTKYCSQTCGRKNQGSRNKKII